MKEIIANIFLGREIVQEIREHFNWYQAEIEGKETFVPKHFVTDKRLNRNYNPTELNGKIGDIIEVKEIHTLWLLAENTQGETGWILAENVVSN